MNDRTIWREGGHCAEALGQDEGLMLDITLMGGSAVLDREDAVRLARAILGLFVPDAEITETFVGERDGARSEIDRLRRGYGL